MTPQATVEAIISSWLNSARCHRSPTNASEVLAATKHDKKVMSGTLHFVAAAVGATTELTDVSDKDVKHALKAIGIRR